MDDSKGPKLISVKYENFRTYTKFTLHLDRSNIIVGPNNAGKSTIILSFRLLRLILRHGRNNRPQIIPLADSSWPMGFILPKSIVPDGDPLRNMENLEGQTKVTFRFSGDKQLILLIGADYAPCCLIDSPKRISTTRDFEQAFNFSVGYIPTLGPLEDKEEPKDGKYLDQWMETHRASLLFRNYWMQYPDNFDEFASLVRDTWPNTKIERPVRAGMFQSVLQMICVEGQAPREIAWAGYGFQIWLQLLTHAVKNKGVDLLVVDEPEIYLHPDLQNRIPEILREYCGGFLMATHSVDIINASEPSDLVIIDKNRSHSQRLEALDDLRTAAEMLGSRQNIHLARIIRAKRLLLVEGLDGRLLREFSKVNGTQFNIDWNSVSIFATGGFGENKKAKYVKWAFSTILHENMSIGLILDRDYRCDEEIADLETELSPELSFFFVLGVKEIENFLLVPSAISRAVNARKAKRHNAQQPLTPDDITSMLDTIFDEFEADTLANLTAASENCARKQGRNPVIAKKACIQNFIRLWKDFNNKGHLVPGKLALTELNKLLQEKHAVSITASSIIRAMNATDMHPNLMRIMRAIAVFSGS